MISDLTCLWCDRPAFAEVDLNINPGRARYPTCPDHVVLAMHHATEALHNAASKAVTGKSIPAGMGSPEPWSTDVTVIDVTEHHGGP